MIRYSSKGPSTGGVIAAMLAVVALNLAIYFGCIIGILFLVKAIFF